MQAVLTNARSLSSISPNGGLLAVKGSRSLQAQKAQRRPTLEQRLSFPRPRKYDKRLVSRPTDSFVSGSTMRRLTSSMWAVRKEAFGGAKQDGKRLLKQIQKQLAFSARCRTSNINTAISTPEIYGVRIPNRGDLQSSFIVDMEYIPFNDVRHVMLEKVKPTNEWMVNTAIDLVDGNLSLSSTAPLGNSLPEFLKNANSIKSAMSRSNMFSGKDCQKISCHLDQVLYLYSNLSHMEIPFGFCHGDLTFANMLVDTENREFCVLDFLDCFVDARHGWFLTQTSIPGDRHGRAVAMLEFYHQKIESAYYDYAFWDAIPLFEYFCLARILPYLTTISEKECVLNGLERIYKGLFGASSMPCDGDVAKSPANLNEPYFETASGATVIVSALGPDMEKAYPAGQIKLLALNSNGRPLIVDSISSLSIRDVTRIVVVVWRPIIEARCGNTNSFERLFDVLGPDRCSKLDFLYVEDQTIDAAETVTMAIKSKAINGSIFIKDADSDYAHSVVTGNYITFTSVIGDS
ncbi:hypothetical protein LTR66_004214 [Elasticomyces elasticus]|nr:hypothetical protein LTR66_004214 [Elasticomyces elasticus]